MNNLDRKKIFESEKMQIYSEILKITNVKFLLYTVREIERLHRRRFKWHQVETSAEKNPS